MPIVATIRSIQVGKPQSLGTPGAPDAFDRPWTSGIVKAQVAGPVHLGRINLDGDAQADLEHHGGPDKAVCCYATAHYPAWQRELSLPDLAYGAFGENLSIAGVTESDLCIGDTFRIGPEAIVQISQPRQPCWKLARLWRIKDLVVQVQNTGRTGWYLRVLHEGTLAPGQSLDLVDRPHPDWSLDRANHLMHHDRSNRDEAAALAAVPALSASWKKTLSNRAGGGSGSSESARLGI
jgi:MOSC domain-containing protein YiiM